MNTMNLTVPVSSKPAPRARSASPYLASAALLLLAAASALPSRAQGTARGSSSELELLLSDEPLVVHRRTLWLGVNGAFSRPCTDRETEPIIGRTARPEKLASSLNS